MSMSQPSSDGAAAGVAGDGSQAMPSDAPAGDAGAGLGAADIANLLAASQTGAWAPGDAAGTPDLQAYDGHVALALDPGTLADIDLTLDLLTSSHQLFDVPVLDVGGSDDVSAG